MEVNLIHPQSIPQEPRLVLIGIVEQVIPPPHDPEELVRVDLAVAVPVRLVYHLLYLVIRPGRRDEKPNELTPTRRQNARNTEAAALQTREREKRD